MNIAVFYYSFTGSDLSFEAKAGKACWFFYYYFDNRDSSPDASWWLALKSLPIGVCLAKWKDKNSILSGYFLPRSLFSPLRYCSWLTQWKPKHVAGNLNIPLEGVSFRVYECFCVSEWWGLMQNANETGSLHCLCTTCQLEDILFFCFSVYSCCIYLLRTEQFIRDSGQSVFLPVTIFLKAVGSTCVRSPESLGSWSAGSQRKRLPEQDPCVSALP